MLKEHGALIVLSNVQFVSPQVLGFGVELLQRLKVCSIKMKSLVSTALLIK